MALTADQAIARMERSLADFQRDLDAEELKLTEETVILFVKKIAFELLKRVTLKTPVDTGRARGNWQVTIGRPSNRSLVTTDREGGATIRKGQAVIDGIQEPFIQVWVTNNVKYILPLEAGTSKQSPEGMVAVTLQELRTIFRKVPADKVEALAA